ncbi:MAG: phosphoadenosine phosphosulfate reductase family protein, partial [Pseudomonadales bacterium]|nr:phosphoadenosine phosphosulfate reductase family protein [Pseudomonadales bacterium]
MSEAVSHPHVFDPHGVAAELEGAAPRDILRTAIERFENVVLSFSGAEDVVLIDMLANMTDRAEIFCLDTGRLHSETLRFLERVRKHYGLAVEVMSPQADAVQRLVGQKGLFSFYE